MKQQFFNIHTFPSKENGFNIPVQIPTDEMLSDEEVIKYAVDNNIITLEQSGKYDMVTWLTENEFKDLGGKVI